MKRSNTAKHRMKRLGPGKRNVLSRFFKIAARMDRSYTDLAYRLFGQSDRFASASVRSCLTGQRQESFMLCSKDRAYALVVTISSVAALFLISFI